MAEILSLIDSRIGERRDFVRDARGHYCRVGDSAVCMDAIAVAHARNCGTTLLWPVVHPQADPGTDHQKIIDTIESPLTDLRADELEPAAWVDRLRAVHQHLATYPEGSLVSSEARHRVSPLLGQARLFAAEAVNPSDDWAQYATGRLTATRQLVLDHLN